MTQTLLLDRSPDQEVAPGETSRASTSMTAIAAKCDSLCLKVGSDLCDAVPALNELARHLAHLAETLRGDLVVEACDTLRELSGGITQITEGLLSESADLKRLAGDNKRLSHLIEVVAEDIRFLSAMITNVKIEAFSLDLTGQGLQAFAEDLAQLASNANATISTCQSTHSALLTRIDRAIRLQTEFEETRQVDLGAIARELAQSIDALDERRSAVSEAASDIAKMTQGIEAQVGQSVLALQIGDNIRQRVEHAGEALEIVALDSEFTALTSEEAACAAAQVGRLQARQLASAAAELDAEMRRIEHNLGEIHRNAADLRQQSHRLVASDTNASKSFLGDLDRRLRQASLLISDYRKSRAKIDDVISAVATTFVELERLGNKVSAMVVDMTIIGMNAIVRSYGLGQRGAGLSVIAQHLRTQALKVSSGIEVLAPAIAQSRQASITFAGVPSDPETHPISRLETGLRSVLGVFDDVGESIDGLAGRLDANVDELNRILPGALDDIAAYHQIELELAAEIDTLERSAARASATLPPRVRDAIESRLTPLYTMAAERHIHADFFGTSSLPAAEVEPDLDDLLF